MRGWHFLINGLKGFGEKDKFSHGIRFPSVFVGERYITLPLNRSEGKEAKLKKKKLVMVDMDLFQNILTIVQKTILFNI